MSRKDKELISSFLASLSDGQRLQDSIPISSESTKDKEETKKTHNIVNMKKPIRRGRQIQPNYPVAPRTIQIIKRPGSYVDHSYRDFSCVPPLPNYEVVRDVDMMSFPQKLHHMLSVKEYDAYITWNLHGRSFRVIVPKRLEVVLLPKYFGHGRFSTFLHDLLRFGFKNVTQGPDQNSHYHECFLRGLPHLCQYLPKPKQARRLIPVPESEPDFYKISAAYPVPNEESEVTAIAETQAKEPTCSHVQPKQTLEFDVLPKAGSELDAVSEPKKATSDCSDSRSRICQNKRKNSKRTRKAEMVPLKVRSARKKTLPVQVAPETVSLLHSWSQQDYESYLLPNINALEQCNVARAACALLDGLNSTFEGNLVNNPTRRPPEELMLQGPLKTLSRVHFPLPVDTTDGANQATGLLANRSNLNWHSGSGCVDASNGIAALSSLFANDYSGLTMAAAMPTDFPLYSTAANGSTEKGVLLDAAARDLALLTKLLNPLAVWNAPFFAQQSAAHIPPVATVAGRPAASAATRFLSQANNDNAAALVRDNLIMQLIGLHQTLREQSQHHLLNPRSLSPFATSRHN